MGEVVLRPEDFDTDVWWDITDAGTVVAAVVADVAHHEVGDSGVWECACADPVVEIARLREVLDRFDTACRQARRLLAAVERDARLRAVNTARRSGSGGD